jgi:phosphoheptose isomerase
MQAYFAELASLASGAGETIGPAVAKAAALVADAALGGRTTLAFGNGGSATQAQHFAAELSVLTACANDYGYETVFARQVEALGRPGDVALGLSTSGRSPNVLSALSAARAHGLATILMTGEAGRTEAERWDVGLVVPSAETAHVQELHLAALHLICRYVDEALKAQR